MSGFDYIKSRETAHKLITQFGRDVAIRRLVARDQFNKPWAEDESSYTDYATKAVMLDFETKEIDGERILSTDSRAFVSAQGLTIEPTNKDLLVVGNDVYTIVVPKPLRPASDVVLYELQVRK